MQQMAYILNATHSILVHGLGSRLDECYVTELWHIYISAAEAIEQLMQAKAESTALDLALNARVRVIRCAGRYI